MCLILYKPSKVRLPKGLFKDVFTKNRDGFGLMFVDTETKKPKIEKILTKNWEECYELYRKYENQACTLHWRYKTQGGINLANAHPHKVTDNIYLVHNGSFGDYNTPNTNEDSDTVQWIEAELRPLIKAIPKFEDFAKSDAGRKIIKSMIGTGNRITLLINQNFYFFGGFSITDEQYVEQMQGILFSNVYAWNNQYWYKNAYQNDINEEYIQKKSNVTTYSRNAAPTSTSGYTNRYAPKKELKERYKDAMDSNNLIEIEGLILEIELKPKLNKLDKYQLKKLKAKADKIAAGLPHLSIKVATLRKKPDETQEQIPIITTNTQDDKAADCNVCEVPESKKVDGEQTQDTIRSLPVSMKGMNGMVTPIVTINRSPSSPNVSSIDIRDVTATLLKKNEQRNLPPIYD